MKLLFSLLLALSTLSAHAGSGTAVLTCTSESGRTVFKAYLQDIVGLLEGAELSIDNKTITFTEEESVVTVFDAKNGVFTMYIQGNADSTYPNGKFIQFWAIPSTFKTVQGHRGHQIYEFKAKLFGTEPRPENGWRTPEMELNCKLEYKI